MPGVDHDPADAPGLIMRRADLDLAARWISTIPPLKDVLKWQRLKPYEKFAKMIDRHWDGIAAYCKPENKVALGFVEGFNNKIRVLQRRAYGLRDEGYLRLKILTCVLPQF
jgi:transposase